MARPNLPNADLIAALSAWGPLAMDLDAFGRFASDWRVCPVDADHPGFARNEYVAVEHPAGLAPFPFANVSRDADVTVELVGNTALNGDGYVRVAAVGGRALAKGQKTAVIPVMGPVTPFPVPKWYAEFGIRVAALPNILAAARAAANDSEVGRIVLAVHSPGGSAFGVGEAASVLRDVAKVKPLIAGVTYLSASAAYWLSSSAREIVAAPSALIGSIGARITHIEVSKALENEGVTVTELSAPESKSDVSQFKPLTDTARAELMRIVETVYSDFAADISKARGLDMVKRGNEYGRVHPASHAQSIGLIDRVATFEALLVESANLGDMTATRRARLAIMERQNPNA